jgi:hypothetical protein
MANPNSSGLQNSPVNQELTDALTKAEERILMEGADVTAELNAIQKDFEPKLKDAWSKVK